MPFQLITEKPAWFILLCLLLGAAYAFVLYRNHSFGEVHPWLKKLMMALRFFLVSLLAFLLLTPLIKTITREKEKPIVIIAQDNSESLVTGKDSSFYRNEYPAKIKAMMQALEKKYDVKTVNWGDRVSDQLTFSYTDKQTDFTGLMNDLAVRYANRNIGAVVIASDGLYNRGSNPVYAGNLLKAPFYTVALGDTTVQKDLLISRVNFNKVVYLGNSFPLEVGVEARQCNGATTTLTVKEDSLILFSKTFLVAANKFNSVIPVFLDAKKKGMHHYHLMLSSVSGEITTVNNEKDIFVDVLESKQKILLLAASPHPDLGALKLSFGSNENYEVKVAMADQFDGKVNDYDLIVLHQVPAQGKNTTGLIAKIKAAKVPVFYIVGTETNINALNDLETGIRINGTLNKSNEVQPLLKDDFSLFTITKETSDALRTFPPLLAPFGEYKLTSNDYVMLSQQIGSVNSGKPLLVLNENGADKSAVLCGEGLWRWRLTDYNNKGNFDAFNELINKLAQYLVVKENKSHFRILGKHTFPENEPIVFDAEVTNDNYELINIPDINITITNGEKKTFPFTFSKTEKTYTLNAGYFPSGNYHYKATVKAGEKIYNNEGEFSISAIQVEQNETTADHQLLYALAHKTGGEMYDPSHLDSLEKALENRDDIKTISYSHNDLKDLINLKWVFFLLLALLSLEWFLRKRSGAY
ncbi:MAG: hypothetical protein NT126_10810 [Bacteroidetes bacterium]|nr:hypothetical protein [Bacteroidota bacterium]